MKLLVGLGNPGTRYADTRHNLGRTLVHHIATYHTLRFSTKKSLQASVSLLEWEGNQVILACPETFMNLSGIAVEKLVRHYGIDFRKDLLIILDDTALPFGIMRLRVRGSDGGHKGLKSINQELMSSQYARLRLGIEMPAISKTLAEEARAASIRRYVLSSFSSGEEKALGSVLERGYEACRLWISRPVESVMNIINIRQK